MSGDREELIRQRAYALWEKDDGRHGRHDDHWAQATREIDGAAAARPKRTAAVKTKPVAGARRVPVAPKASPAAKPPIVSKVAATGKAKPVKAAARSPKAPAVGKPKTG